MSETKNVIIIGLSYAGIAAAKELAASLPKEYRIIAIERNEFAYHAVPSLRAAVIPGWENKIPVPLDNIFPSRSHHITFTGVSVSGITQDTVQLEKSIIIDGVETNTISFAFLVLATGSKSTFPVRPTVFTIEGVKKAFTDFQQDLSKAKKVLVVGGGPVGFEFAGEVTEFYNGTNGRDKKQVTLVSSGKHLLDPTFKQGTHNKALALLKNSGVNTILGQTITLPEGINNGSLGETKTFNLSSGETVEADFILLGIGSRPNNDIVVAGLGQSAVDLKSGRVLVNSTLQLKEYPNIFAIGDINSIAENKMAAWTGAHAAIVGKNIKALISNTPLKDYKAVSPGMLASYGAKAGAGQLFGISPPSFLAAIIKSKSLFTSMLWSSANATLSS